MADIANGTPAASAARTAPTPGAPVSRPAWLDWASQHKKMQTPAIGRRLGVSIGAVPYAGQMRDMASHAANTLRSYAAADVMIALFLWWWCLTTNTNAKKTSAVAAKPLARNCR